MRYWVVRAEGELLIRASGPHYAEASAWDAYYRITESKTADEARAYSVVDEYDNEQQAPAPKRISKH